MTATPPLGNRMSGPREGEIPVVVVADPIDPAAIDRLRAGPCRLVDATAGPAALEAALPSAYAVIVRSRTKLTRERIASAPRLSLIARAGVGVDNIDVAAATERHVRVVNAPEAATTSVAELAIALYLSLVRGLVPAIEATRAGNWDRTVRGRELAGKTVGFVGFGRIARAIAQRLEPFGVERLAYDPYWPAPVPSVRRVEFETLLRSSDIVSVHAALTPENHHLLNAAAFAAMRESSYLVNLARGALVDEAALIAALDSGRIAGAALDVYEVEPPTNERLLRHPRVLPTPHLGASTIEGQARAGRLVVDDVLRDLRGEPLHGLVNPTARPA